MVSVRTEISLFHPAFILIAGHLFYFILFLLSPLKIEILPSFESYFVYFIAFSIFLFGLTLTFKFPIKRDVVFSLSYDEKIIIKFFYIIIILILIGILLRIIDRFYFRGVNLLMSSYERKKLIEASESSIFSVLSSFIFPAGLFILPLKKILKIKSSLLTFLSILIFIYPAFDVVLTGNRGLMIVTLFMYISLLLITNEFKKNKKKIIVVSLVFLMAFGFSLYVFLDRITSFGFTPKYSANYSHYAFTMKPNEQANKIMEGNTAFPILVFAYVNFSQYYLHGLLEWGYLYDNFELGKHTYGNDSFYIIKKFLDKVTGETRHINTKESYPRSGVYTTFLGPFYIDFGFVVFFILLLGGYIIKNIWTAIVIGHIEWVPLMLYLYCVIFFFPVVNFIQSALGTYILASFGLIYFFFLKLMKHIKIKSVS